MKQYTNRQTIMISDIQLNSLSVLKSYGINVSQFIRAAIKEKIKKDWREIKLKKDSKYCPFSNNTIRI